jgi:hypothetical protein
VCIIVTLKRNADGWAYPPRMLLGWRVMSVTILLTGYQMKSRPDALYSVMLRSASRRG